MHSMTDHRWTTKGPDITAKDQLEQIRQALCEDWIGGVHYFYCAGCSGDSVAFSRYGDFLVQVTASRPGDWFILWWVAELRRRGLLLADNRYVNTATSGESLLSTTDLDRVEQYLAEQKLNEALCIWSDGVGELKTILSDADEELRGWLVDAARGAAVPGGALIVLPFTLLHKTKDYFVSAKCPNDEGEVPLGGAY
jgi:hypothetical protein